MTRVTGPLFSLTASGTYKREIVFRTRGSGTFVSKLPTITQPRSTAQQNHAAQVADMSAAWSALAPAVKVQWSSCGVALNLSGYQTFFQEWFLQGSSPGNNPTLPC